MMEPIESSTPEQGNSTDGRLAFVFAGGGSLGAVQVGMLLALTEFGIRPDLVIGSSVGAINAAYYSACPTSEGVQRLATFWIGLRRADVFPLAPLQGALGALNRRNSLLSSSALRAVIAHAIPFRDLSEAVIPCHVVATDAISGEAVVLSTGDPVDVLLASTAIPAIFPPVAIDGRLLLDGAVGNTTPIALAVALGASRVVVLPTGFSCAAIAPPAGALGMLLHSASLMTMRQLHTDIVRVSSGPAHVVSVPPICPLNVSAYDFSHATTLIERSHRATQEWLDAGGLEQRDVSMALLPHGHSLLHAGN